MKKRLSKIINVVLPYFLVFAGFLLVLITPLSFYSNKNLTIPSSINYTIGKTNVGTKYVEGGDIQLSSFPKSNPITPIVRNNDEYSGEISAKAVYILDEKSKKILYTKSEKDIRSLASITKLMSAIVLLDFPYSWSSTTTIIEEDGNSDQIVKLGEIYTMDDLWHSALIGSSNKAINALVRSAGLNKEAFVDRMNKRAKELNLNSLHFTEPTGLSSGNVGSAVDISSLLHEAMRFDKIYSTLKIREHYARPLNQEKSRLVWSTNWLLTDWVPNNFKIGNLVGKTGFINESGYNFVSSITNERNGRSIIVCVLGAETNEKRFEETRDLANFVFSKYVWPEDKEYVNLVE